MRLSDITSIYSPNKYLREFGNPISFQRKLKSVSLLDVNYRKKGIKNSFGTSHKKLDFVMICNFPFLQMNLLASSVLLADVFF